MSVFGAVSHSAHAQTIDPAAKLAPDLVTALNALTPPKVDWLKIESTGRASPSDSTSPSESVVGE